MVIMAEVGLEENDSPIGQAQIDDLDKRSEQLPPLVVERLKIALKSIRKHGIKDIDDYNTIFDNVFDEYK